VARTIEVWVKYTGASSWTAEQSILETGRRPAGNAPNGVMGFDNSGYTAGSMTAHFGPYTNGYSDNNGNGVSVMNIPQVGWVHLSWSYPGNHQELSFTVGTPTMPATQQTISHDQGTAGMPTLALTQGIVTLGASQTFGTTGWEGVMDELRIWSVGRTVAEVNRDMKVVLKGTETGLAAYYRFDEGTGNFTDDVSKKASHRLTTCAATNMTTCAAQNANPSMVNWVASDLPGPFTCAP
jgi:hypothetical protein